MLNLKKNKNHKPNFIILGLCCIRLVIKTYKLCVWGNPWGVTSRILNQSFQNLWQLFINSYNILNTPVGVSDRFLQILFKFFTWILALFSILNHFLYFGLHFSKPMLPIFLTWRIEKLEENNPGPRPLGYNIFICGRNWYIMDTNCLCGIYLTLGFVIGFIKSI